MSPQNLALRKRHLKVKFPLLFGRDSNRKDFRSTTLEKRSNPNLNRTRVVDVASLGGTVLFVTHNCAQLLERMGGWAEEDVQYEKRGVRKPFQRLHFCNTLVRNTTWHGTKPHPHTHSPPTAQSWTRLRTI